MILLYAEVLFTASTVRVRARWALTLGLLSLTLSAATAAHAQSSEGNITTLGMGVAATPRYEGSASYHAVPFPVISASHGAFFLDGLNAGVRFNLGPQVKAGVILTPDFGRDASDGARLGGLGDVKTSLDYGGFASWQLAGFETSVKYLQSAHSGYGATLTLVVKYKLKLSAHDSLELGGETIWANRESMQTLFGLTPQQAENSYEGLPAYSPSAGFKRVSTSATWVHILNRSWSLDANIGAGQLLGDASNSPLTEKSAWLFGGVGAAYSF